MQKLVPSVWFNGTALEAAEFYARSIPHTQLTNVVRYPTEGLPEFQKDFAGKPLVVDIEIDGFRVSLTNADDTYAPNPSMSIMLNFDPAQMDNAQQALTDTWNALSAEGHVLMPLGEYDFSPHYGWCADRYGVNWQLMLTQPEGEPRPFVIPAMLFTQAARGKAAEARQTYIEALTRVGESRPGNRVDYPDNDGVILFSDAKLAGEWVVINDSTFDHDFGFTPGMSFQVLCDGQEQIDQVWEALAHIEQPCGWCTDKFGVSWQILPNDLGELMESPGAYGRLMSMTRIQIDDLGGAGGQS